MGIAVSGARQSTSQSNPANTPIVNTAVPTQSLPTQEGNAVHPAGKHSTMILSTDFDLEPVIEQFQAQYGDDPNIDVPQIIFKSIDERVAGDRAYVLLFELRPPSGRRMRFSDFLKAYCVLHNLTAIGTNGSVFPSIEDPRGFSVFGMPDNKR
jgi:hypothetical protein